MTAECNAGCRIKSAPLACNLNFYSAEGDKPKQLQLSVNPKALTNVSIRRKFDQKKTTPFFGRKRILLFTVIIFLGVRSDVFLSRDMRQMCAQTPNGSGACLKIYLWDGASAKLSPGGETALLPLRLLTTTSAYRQVFFNTARFAWRWKVSRLGSSIPGKVLVYF